MHMHMYICICTCICIDTQSRLEASGVESETASPGPCNTANTASGRPGPAPSMPSALRWFEFLSLGLPGFRVLGFSCFRVEGLGFRV